MDEVILVNEHDQQIGTMEKLEAHRKGVLHRAFSVMIENSKGEILIQKRAKSKYHSGGLWSNACCSHPKPGEKTEEAVSRRISEELGIELAPTFSYKFIYEVTFSNKLIEHELDHVFVTTYDGIPKINKAEVEDWKFVAPQQLLNQIEENPDQYTHWFKIILTEKYSVDKV
jgi:isopentenyl-diphosphate delta-isomerase